MRRDTVLQVVDGLALTLDGAHGTTARGADGSAIECGPHGLEILEAFHGPASIEVAVARLASRAGSGTGLGEMLRVVRQLRESGCLVTPEHAARLPRSATGFAAAAIHVSMLDDRARTEAFLHAIRDIVTPGDVVIDLGTGTGVLAIAAARAGARRVFAIEGTKIADAAEAMIAASGVGDRITLVRGWSTDVALDERADVLVTETLGHDPWDEGFLHLTADARRRLLRPGARLIPNRVRRLAQPVTVPHRRRRALGFTEDAVRRWTEQYGIDFTPLLATEDAHTSTVFLRSADVREWPALCPAVRVTDTDPYQEAVAPRAGNGHAVAQQAGILDGVILYWEADLAPGISLSTHRETPDSASSWRVQLVLAQDGVQVRPGDVVTVSLHFGSPPRLTLSVDPVSPHAHL